MTVKEITKPKTHLSEEVHAAIKEQQAQEGQVIVHCHFKNESYFEVGIRIWKTTFLCPTNAEDKIKLMHAENITMYPTYTGVKAYQSHHFTLVFSALPKDCSLFHLVEEIPEPGAFRVDNISRNQTDIYHVNIY